MTVLILTCKTLMNSVHSIDLASSVEHVSTTSVTSLEHLHVGSVQVCAWALLWVPVIALAGIALVVLLIVLNLTVSVGTINGLIFYANIVRANHATFFPPNTTNSFLSWFIAWINLDLGIETCFYNGLDAYVKTWLQFVFPLYIWFLVIAIIILSHYYTLAARLSGRNAVPVLATLFLISYAKLLRIIITVFQSTDLEYPDNIVRKIWFYDGNVDYLKGKHNSTLHSCSAPTPHLHPLHSHPHFHPVPPTLVQLQSVVLGEETEATL